MPQEIINVLMIFVLPAVVGIVLRLIFFKWRRGYIVDILCAVLAVVLWGVAFFVPSYGSEGNALLAMMATLLTAGTLASGAVVQIVRGRKR